MKRILQPQEIDVLILVLKERGGPLFMSLVGSSTLIPVLILVLKERGGPWHETSMI